MVRLAHTTLRYNEYHHATDAEAAQNARYVVSLARKLGGGSAAGLIVWEDIVYGRHKALLPFVGWIALKAGQGQKK